jgi:hypothetical protein
VPLSKKVVLFNNHFVKQIGGACKLVDDEKHIPHIRINIAAMIRIEYQVAHGSFTSAVEINTN